MVGSSPPNQGSPGLTAQGVRWNLAQIFADDEAAAASLDEADRVVRELRVAYTGRIAMLSPSEVSALLERLDGLHCRIAAVRSYARLRMAEDTTNPGARDLSAAVTPRVSELFSVAHTLDRELQSLSAGQRDELRWSPELERHRHLLERLWDRDVHALDPAMEHGLALRGPLVRDWQVLHRRTLAAVRVIVQPYDGPMTVADALALGRQSDRTLRMRARCAVVAGVRGPAPTLASAYDALVGDRWQTSRARGFAHPIQSVNLDNELDDDVVSTLVENVERRYDVAQRWYRAKARLIGVPCATTADETAPVGAMPTYTFDDACELVLGSLEPVWATGAAVLRELIIERRIHAEPTHGKEAGTFCRSVAPNRTSMILMTFRGSTADVLDLAHECGHAIHFALASEQPARLSNPPLVLAETPALFMEMLAMDALLARERDPAIRLSLLGCRIQSDYASTFHQIMLMQFEMDAYAARNPGAISVKTLSDTLLSQLWDARKSELFAESVERDAGDTLDWCWTPHFISGTFLTYAYAFAHMVALALHTSMVERGPESFFPDFNRLLAAGGSAPPGDLLERAGISILGSEWIGNGIADMERTLDEIERSVPAVGPR